MKTRLCLSVLLTILVSCNTRQAFVLPDPDPQRSALSPDECRVLASLYQPKTISKDRAIAYALFAAADFGKNDASSKSAQRMVGDVSIVVEPSRGVAAKSGATEIDTTLYIVNYDQGNGFVLISAKASSAGVLTFSTEGSLYPTDTIRDPGFAIFLSRIEDYQAAQEAELKHLQDSLAAIVLAKINHDNSSEMATKILLPPSDPDPTHQPTISTELLSITEIYRQAPLLRVNWNQGSYENPNAYNRLTPNNCVAGCVPVAVAQIMSYHKQPAYYDNSYFDWDHMTRLPSANSLDPTYQQQVSMLLENLGAWQNLRVNYTPNASGANSEDVPRTLSNFGYKVPTGLMNYSISRIINSLKSNRPVYASGYAKETVYNWILWVDIIHDEGHAWVIDGYYTNRKDYKTTISPYNASYTGEESTYSYFSKFEDYVHCNMGWGGSSNTYYLSGVFQTSKYNFQYKLQIIPDIYY